MKTIGNILWVICGGLLTAVLYWMAAILCCCTIIGIPFAVQLFKIGLFALWPFGSEMVDSTESGGCINVAMNVLWVLLGWWEIALVHLVIGLLFCLTIIGIPFGLQHFRIAIASLIPFGKEIR